jgi:DnaA family protein
MNERSATQLAIAFPFEPRYTLDNFVAGDNAELVARLANWHEDATTSVIWVYGEPRSGRSHLLQGTCAAFARRERRTAYVPARLVAGAPESLRGLGAMQLVALDDLEAWLGSRDVEEALFALHRTLLGEGGRLLVASRASPPAVSFVLPDLASRLRAGAVHALQPLTDELKGRVVADIAAQRGLKVPKDVLRYLFTKGPRDIGGLLAAIDRLDRAAMIRKRRVTLPLAREVLGL